MTGALVAYASSDSEDGEETPTQSPMEISGTEEIKQELQEAPVSRTDGGGEAVQTEDSTKSAPQQRHGPDQQAQDVDSPAPGFPPPSVQPASQSSQATRTATSATAIGPSIPRDGPAPLESGSTTPTHHRTTSAYTRRRQQIQNLTLPTQANFSIPDSPPQPSTPTAASAHAASTQKFAKFLALKRGHAGPQATGSGEKRHFHVRLLISTALQNPSLTATLFRFAGLRGGEQYAQTLSEEGGGGVPASWPGICYVENLVAEAEMRRKGRKAKAKGKMEFVPSRQGGERDERPPEKRPRVGG